MGFLAFLLLGLIAGAIAKAILTGRQGGGLLLTMLLGICAPLRWLRQGQPLSLRSLLRG
jgi:uncharacterized membrane protein YeaQ/YmgE (transglycosylase-associated protein family)